MRLDPFVAVDGLPFSATMDELRLRHGLPRHEQDNDVGLHELDYGAVVYRFQCSTGRLEEVTQRAPVLHLPGGIAVPFATLQAFVREHDPDAFRAAGFLVSPRYGVAFDPADSNWVTALAAHCVPQWRALATRPPP